MELAKMKECPIHVTLEKTSIGKKWTLTIIRDLILGIDRFKDFQRNNRNLSAKVLSERLRDMEDDGLLEKIISEVRPLTIRYQITKKGADLHKILYEFSIYGAKYFPQDVFGLDYVSEETCIDFYGKAFKLDSILLDYMKQPVIAGSVVI